MADEIGNRPVIVDEVGVKLPAVCAIVALMITRAYGLAKVLVGNHRVFATESGYTASTDLGMAASNVSCEP